MKATPEIIARIYALLGRVVLLPIASKEKCPKFKEWQKTTWEQSQAEAYQKKLVGGNIGVLTGTPSDGLVAVDVDDDELFAQFMKLNPQLADTFVSKGRRGAQIWFRCAERPDLQARGFVTQWPHLKPLKWPQEAPPPGKSKEEMPPARSFGEWRGGGTGCQSVVWGTHPEGMSYQWLSAKPAKVINLRDIRWPVGLPLPWLEQIEKNVRQIYGEPWTVIEDNKGNQTIGTIMEPYWGGMFMVNHEVLFEPGEGRYYVYQGSSGLWKRAEDGEMLVEMGRDMLTASRALQVAEIAAPRFRSAKVINGVLQWLKGYAVKRNAFPLVEGRVHLRNGVLDLTTGTPILRPFAPEFYSRNQIPVDYRPEAQCPRFLNQLLAAALPPDDIELLQRWAGMWLMGVNIRQKMLLLTGTAGGGKSTVVKVFTRLIGQDNVAQLRTELLAERFELSNYVGKTGLVGADVPGNFLMRPGAYVLKSLTGGDMMTTEAKGVNDRLTIEGRFNVVVTSNSKLKLHLDADADAWRRRLLIINYERPPAGEKIADFDKVLVEEEGGGILNWMIAGALKVLAGDKLAPNTRQQAIVDGLLEESDSVRSFVKRCIFVERGKDVTGEELQAAYAECCEKFGWTAVPAQKLEKLLPDLILEQFRTPKTHNIIREGKSRRGWKHLHWSVPDFGDPDDETASKPKQTKPNSRTAAPASPAPSPEEDDGPPPDLGLDVPEETERFED